MDEEERKLVEEVMADYHELRKKFLGDKADEIDSWILEESAKVTAAEERARKKWEALSDEEKERRANSPEVLEARFWEDLSDWDPVIISKSHPDKNESDH